LWETTYPTSIPTNAPLHTALTDTFHSAIFFREVLASPGFARRWRGIRQDSGDPLEFARDAKRVYEGLGIDVSTKMIVFSDGLDVKRTLEIKKANDEEIGFQGSNRETFQDVENGTDECTIQSQLISEWARL
jgi:nicotinate phosphoribosyltransferase